MMIYLIMACIIALAGLFIYIIWGWLRKEKEKVATLEHQRERQLEMIDHYDETIDKLKVITGAKNEAIEDFNAIPNSELLNYLNNRMPD